MLYKTAQDWIDAPRKSLLLFGMSGLGKTHVSNILRDSNDWFHYSIDYRIGTRYMGEHIVDNFKAHALRDPFLAELLRSDSIYIASNITFNNLAPLSTYLGKPGDPTRGGLAIEEYRRRQSLHHEAEINALLDTDHFRRRAHELYGYQHFVADTGGSICEVVDPWDLQDPVMQQLANTHLMVWLEGSDAHTDELIRRFDKSPKPMCYQPEFLTGAWDQYLNEFNAQPDKVNPDDFIRWTYARAMAHRQPRYAAMADNWGLRLTADKLADAPTAEHVIECVARAIEARG